MKVIAPGKIIISGEHAVVQGQGALAMAVNRYAKINISLSNSPLIGLKITDLNIEQTFTRNELKQLYHRINYAYQQFKANTIPIQDVLQEPHELVAYVLANIIVNYANYVTASGWNVYIESTIPVGCGMGSSAAIVISLLYTLNKFFKLNLKNTELLNQALIIENLQHGHSSGLDTNLSWQGGVIYFQRGKTEAINFPDWPFYIVNSGVPESNTGECVLHTLKYFSEHAILNKFDEVIKMIKLAIQQENFNLFTQAIKNNHRLLCQLDVVPEQIKQFITALEKQGAAAKICGAGSLKGHRAGIILIFSKKSPLLICQQFNFPLLTIQREQHGVREI